MGKHTNAGSIRTIHCIVRGTVQGVGFRHWTKTKALALGVSGSVCNLPDGSVEVFASAPDSTLQPFIKDLHSGPPGAVVTDVLVSTLNTTRVITKTFEIIR